MNTLLIHFTRDGADCLINHRRFNLGDPSQFGPRATDDERFWLALEIATQYAKTIMTMSAGDANEWASRNQGVFINELKDVEAGAYWDAVTIDDWVSRWQVERVRERLVEVVA